MPNHPPKLVRSGCLATVLFVGALGGCTQYHQTAELASMKAEASVSTIGLTPPAPVTALGAICAPPLGWSADPLKQSEKHTHQVWLSPTRNTAYGVIYIRLPFPVGVDLVHWQFLREMRKTEGEAIDLGEDYDDKLPGLRFVAEGGLYKLRANLIVRGSEAWVPYAGTLRTAEVNPAELRLAEQARENTTPGLTGASAANAE